MAHDVDAAGALSIAREALELLHHHGSGSQAQTLRPRLLQGSPRRRGSGRVAQDARTRACLGALPFRDAIRDRFEEILKVESTSYDELSLGGSTYFALKIQPPRQQPFLVAVRRPCAMRE